MQKAYSVLSDENAEVNGKEGEHCIGLQHVDNSQEALPICVPPIKLTVHYTPVMQEVVVKGADDLLDIDDWEDE